MVTGLELSTALKRKKFEEDVERMFPIEMSVSQSESDERVRVGFIWDIIIGQRKCIADAPQPPRSPTWDTTRVNNTRVITRMHQRFTQSEKTKLDRCISSESQTKHKNILEKYTYQSKTKESIGL